MKIKKIGHCCLVIEIGDKRLMTDPGAYSTLQTEEKDIDLILITHEHPDHLHVESLQKVLANNPTAKIVTNTAVATLLEKEGIAYTKIEHNEQQTLEGILIEGFGEHHEEVYKTFGQVQNTGYFVSNKFFYPGDAFTNPGKPVDILALPVAGPWMRIKNALEYALELKPRVCFPVHDGMIMPDKPGPIYRLPQTILSESGIEFKVLTEGKMEEL